MLKKVLITDRYILKAAEEFHKEKAVFQNLDWSRPLCLYKMCGYQKRITNFLVYLGKCTFPV